MLLCASDADPCSYRSCSRRIPHTAGQRNETAGRRNDFRGACWGIPSTYVSTSISLPSISNFDPVFASCDRQRFSTSTLDLPVRR